MTRVFLAAGVAALAIAAPASAGPGGHGGGKDRPAQAQRGGGGGGHQQAQAVGGGRHAGGGGGQRMQAFGGGGRHGGGGFAAPQMQHQQRFAAAERPQRAQHVQMRAERQQAHGNRMNVQTRSAERQQMRANRAQAQNRMAQRQQMRANHAQAQNRVAERQQMRANRAQAQNRMAQREQMRANRAQMQNRMAERQQLRGNRAEMQNRMAERQQMQLNRQNMMAERQQMRGNRQLNQQNLMAQRQQLRGDRMAAVQNQLVLRNNARFENVDRVRAFAPVVGPLTIERTRIIPVGQAAQFIGSPLSTVDNIVPLAAFPTGFSYLYPDTPNYYYQYGGGYAYQVDRTSGLIAALLPLLGGGFLPGQYLPSPYMSSYVPSYYGLNSFYPASYGGYSPYGYDNLCNRYEYGVVYQVDCYSGLVQNVIPLYAGGYGVGQMLPSAYNYYNVPMQYRSMYYPTADYSYWYAPGAIYQYSPQTSLITSVAALMSPGFSIGQPLPAGYGMYNVPLAYRSTYYDTADAWYRYNNGYIYQVNPATQLVTAVVASLLT